MISSGLIQTRCSKKVSKNTNFFGRRDAKEMNPSKEMMMLQKYTDVCVKKEPRVAGREKAKERSKKENISMGPVKAGREGMNGNESVVSRTEEQKRKKKIRNCRQKKFETTQKLQIAEKKIRDMSPGTILAQQLFSVF